MPTRLVTRGGRRQVDFDPGDLLRITCDYHPARSLLATAQTARVRGWAVWRGRSMTGSAMRVALCPECRGTRR